MQVLHDFEEWHLRYSFIQFSCFPCPSAKLPSLCRLDLEAGTFLTPLEMQKLTEINEVVTILALRIFKTFQQSASQKFAFRFLSE